MSWNGEPFAAGSKLHARRGKHANLKGSIAMLHGLLDAAHLHTCSRTIAQQHCTPLFVCLCP